MIVKQNKKMKIDTLINRFEFSMAVIVIQNVLKT